MTCSRVVSAALLTLLGVSRAVAASPQSAVGPAMVDRTAEDNVTVRTLRLEKPLRIDGRLDEEVYASLEAISDFIQQEPHEGAPATEKTDAWILFDDANLYIAARCWNSHPEREIANELRRDNGNVLGNENFTFVIDSLHDRRNGYLFQTNPLGALRDMTVTDDQQNSAWNGIWFVKTGRFEHGWTMEVAIPFKTLRYRGSGAQQWGINLRRLVKWKNEISYLSLVPAALGVGGVSRMASAATLVGLETPAQSKNLELKPYAVSSLTDGPDRGGAVHQRPERQRRLRLQVWPDAQPDRRRHVPDRLRAGRGGSPADQPDALQPVLSREARLFHRRPGHLRLRRGAGGEHAR
jgi:hypothetical protein